MSEIKVAEISEYELQIQRNIEERKKMFEILQLNNVKQELLNVSAKSCKRKIKIDGDQEQRKMPNQVQSAQFGVKKHWYQSIIMTFYQFSEETKKIQPNSKQDVIGMCIICEKQITGQIIHIRNWKNHLQICHQEVPEWKEYIKKTQEIKEQRMKYSHCMMPSPFIMSVHKPYAQHTMSTQPLLRMVSTPQSRGLKEVDCHMLHSLPLQGTSKQPSLTFALNKEYVAPYQPDSTISECCMIEESGLPVDADPPIHAIRTRRQSKRLRASTSFED